MKHVFFSLVLLLSTASLAQTEEAPYFEEPKFQVAKPPDETALPEPDGEPFNSVDEPAEFPGGADALRKYLAQNVRYPQSAIENHLQGKCYLKFVVSATGKISGVSVQRGVTDCPECDMEAARVVRSMPNWKPGKNAGKPVACYYHLPITFKLSDPDEEPKK
jgi:periplasmic protein TonB